MKKGDAPNNRNDANRVHIPKEDRDKVLAAHEQAEKDMNEDPELTASSPNDDLDEGESARLGEESTDVI